MSTSQNVKLSKCRFLKTTIYQNVDAFIDEIEDVKKKGLLKGKLVMFTDSTFNSHRKWFLEFCEKVKKVGGFKRAKKSPFLRVGFAYP